VTDGPGGEEGNDIWRRLRLAKRNSAAFVEAERYFRRAIPLDLGEKWWSPPIRASQASALRRYDRMASAIADEMNGVRGRS
jgi:hypothetical protein